MKFSNVAVAAAAVMAGVNGFAGVNQVSSARFASRSVSSPVDFAVLGQIVTRRRTTFCELSNENHAFHDIVDLQ